MKKLTLGLMATAILGSLVAAKTYIPHALDDSQKTAPCPSGQSIQIDGKCSCPSDKILRPNGACAEKATCPSGYTPVNTAIDTNPNHCKQCIGNTSSTCANLTCPSGKSHQSDGSCI